MWIRIPDASEVSSDSPEDPFLPVHAIGGEKPPIFLIGEEICFRSFFSSGHMMDNDIPIRLRPLEREDLPFVHQLDNNASVMRYWFEEPYEAFVELLDLYDKHIHDQSERRFIVEHDKVKVGLVELMEIDYIHRRAEFQLIIAPAHQGLGYAARAVELIMDYSFTVLNLYKLYLLVDTENKKAIHIYEKLGFETEGELKHEFFSNGKYRNALRMCMFQNDYLARREVS